MLEVFASGRYRYRMLPDVSLIIVIVRRMLPFMDISWSIMFVDVDRVFADGMSVNAIHLIGMLSYLVFKVYTVSWLKCIVRCVYGVNNMYVIR